MCGTSEGCRIDVYDFGAWLAGGPGVSRWKVCECVKGKTGRVQRRKTKKMNK